MASATSSLSNGSFSFPQRVGPSSPAASTASSILLDLAGAKDEPTAGGVEDLSWQRAVSELDRFASAQDPQDRSQFAVQLLKQELEGHAVHRGDLYSYLIRYLGKNQQRASISVWELFVLLASCTPPPPRHAQAVLAFVEASGRDFRLGTTVARLAEQVTSKLQRSTVLGPRLTVPAEYEVAALLSGREVEGTVWLLDGSRLKLLYDFTTSVKEATQQLIEGLDLENAAGFELYEVRSLGDGGNGAVKSVLKEQYWLLDWYKRIADVLREICSSSPEGKLLFKRRALRVADEGINEPAFLHLCYMQAQQEYLLGRYLAPEEQAARLCALQLLAGSPDPIAATQSASLRTAVKRFIPPKVYKTRSKAEWISEVMHECRELLQMPKQDPRLPFLNTIRALPLGSAWYFTVHNRDSLGGLPVGEMILGVNHRGIHFLAASTKQHLHSVELRNIMSFGHDKGVVCFKTRVAGVERTLNLNSKDAKEICLVMDTGISNIVMKRRNAKGRRDAGPWSARALDATASDITGTAETQDSDQRTERIERLPSRIPQARGSHSWEEQGVTQRTQLVDTRVPSQQLYQQQPTQYSSQAKHPQVDQRPQSQLQPLPIVHPSMVVNTASPLSLNEQKQLPAPQHPSQPHHSASPQAQAQLIGPSVTQRAPVFSRQWTAPAASREASQPKQAGQRRQTSPSVGFGSRRDTGRTSGVDSRRGSETRRGIGRLADPRRRPSTDSRALHSRRPDVAGQAYNNVATPVGRELRAGQEPETQVGILSSLGSELLALGDTHDDLSSMEDGEGDSRTDGKGKVGKRFEEPESADAEEAADDTLRRPYDNELFQIAADLLAASAAKEALEVELRKTSRKSITHEAQLESQGQEIERLRAALHSKAVEHSRAVQQPVVFQNPSFDIEGQDQGDSASADKESGHFGNHLADIKEIPEAEAAASEAEADNHEQQENGGVSASTQVQNATSYEHPPHTETEVLASANSDISTTPKAPAHIASLKAVLDELRAELKLARSERDRAVEDRDRLELVAKTMVARAQSESSVLKPEEALATAAAVGQEQMEATLEELSAAKQTLQELRTLAVEHTREVAASKEALDSACIERDEMARKSKVYKEKLATYEGPEANSRISSPSSLGRPILGSNKPASKKPEWDFSSSPDFVADSISTAAMQKGLEATLHKLMVEAAPLKEGGAEGEAERLQAKLTDINADNDRIDRTQALQDLVHETLDSLEATTRHLRVALLAQKALGDLYLQKAESEKLMRQQLEDTKAALASAEEQLAALAAPAAQDNTTKDMQTADDAPPAVAPVAASDDQGSEQSKSGKATIEQGTQEQEAILLSTEHSTFGSSTGSISGSMGLADHVGLADPGQTTPSHAESPTSAAAHAEDAITQVARDQQVTQSEDALAQVPPVVQAAPGAPLQVGNGLEHISSVAPATGLLVKTILDNKEWELDCAEAELAATVQERDAVIQRSTSAVDSLRAEHAAKVEALESQLAEQQAQLKAREDELGQVTESLLQAVANRDQVHSELIELQSRIGSWKDGVGPFTRILSTGSASQSPKKGHTNPMLLRTLSNEDELRSSAAEGVQQSEAMTTQEACAPTEGVAGTEEKALEEQQEPSDNKAKIVPSAPNSGLLTEMEQDATTPQRTQPLHLLTPFEQEGSGAQQQQQGQARGLVPSVGQDVSAVMAPAQQPELLLPKEEGTVSQRQLLPRAIPGRPRWRVQPLRWGEGPQKGLQASQQTKASQVREAPRVDDHESGYLQPGQASVSHSSDTPTSSAIGTRPYPEETHVEELDTILQPSDLGNSRAPWRVRVVQLGGVLKPRESPGTSEIEVMRSGEPQAPTQLVEVEGSESWAGGGSTQAQGSERDHSVPVSPTASAAGNMQRGNAISSGMQDKRHASLFNRLLTAPTAARNWRAARALSPKRGPDKSIKTPISSPRQGQSSAKEGFMHKLKARLAAAGGGHSKTAGRAPNVWRDNELSGEASWPHPRHATERTQLENRLSELTELYDKAVAEVASTRHMLDQQKFDKASLVLEVHKLSQENDLLSQRLAAINLRTKHELHLASGSTPGGSKADEVHLRQELDERSHQCTVLLRERLQLEQCIRYLAVRSGLASVEPKGIRIRDQGGQGEPHPRSGLRSMLASGHERRRLPKAGALVQSEQGEAAQSEPSYGFEAAAAGPAAGLDWKPAIDVEQKILKHVAAVCAEPQSTP